MCRNVTIMMRHDKQVSKHFTLDRIFMHSAYLWTRWLDAKATTKYCFVNGDNLSHALLAKQSGTRHNVERSYLAMTPLGMVRRGRRRVIEGNERLLLITPCLLSGVHTCFRNILPAVYNQAALCTRKRMLSRVSRLGSWILTHVPVYRTESFDKAVCRGTLSYQGTRGHCRSFGAWSLYKLSFADYDDDDASSDAATIPPLSFQQID